MASISDLRFGRSTGGGIKHAPSFFGSTLDLDFVRNRGAALGVFGGLPASSLLTTTRASTAYADDSAGVWSAFSPNIPRIAGKGLLVEEARTNLIRNNSMQGAVAGTPGTDPINWAFSPLGGLAKEIVGTGTQNGIDYIDVRLSGSALNESINLFFEQAAETPAADGQSWTEGVFAAQVGGDFTNISGFRVHCGIYDAGLAFLSNMWGATSHTSLPASLTPASRLDEDGTIANAAAAFLRPYVQWAFGTGPVDLTVRIGWPQLELGPYYTTPIRTTA